MSPREFPAMDFDSKRGVTVCFGGYGDRSSETWEWDGEAWALRATTGPSYRLEDAMAYDSARGVMVLQGGSDFNETWEWDGKQWDLKSTAGPHLYGIAMTYDSDRHVIVVYGGQPGNGNPLVSETWEWDGMTWTLAASTGPSPRIRSRIAFDAAHHVTVLFGGTIGAVSGFDDTWTWDGRSWQQMATSGPPGRFGHSMKYDTDAQRIIMFGGGPTWGGALSDTWEWDGSAWTMTSTSDPSARHGAGMAYDSSRHTMVLYGGLQSFGMSGDKSDTWERVNQSWVVRVPSGPTERLGAQMVYDQAAEKTFMFGGAGGVITNELWEWDNAMWTYLGNDGPLPRSGHAMAYDSARRVAVMFGGGGSYSYPLWFGDTWEWDGVAGTWTLRASTGPSARVGHAMSYDSDRNVTVLFGGDGGVAYGGHETWEWDGDNAVWILRAITGPSARSGAGMCYDSDRKVTILFGGNSYASLNDETWEWNGESWTLRASSGPSPRSGAQMWYDPILHATVLFGGLDALDEVWMWNGTTWQRHFYLNGTESRHGHAMAIDPVHHVVTMFGGFAFGSGSDTWELRLAIGPTVTVSPSFQGVPLFGVAEFSVQAQGTGALHYQWLKDGENLEDGGNISGAQTATLTISPATLTDIDEYLVIVTDDTCGEVSQDVYLDVIPPPGDANGDGLVNQQDLSLVIAAWGFCDYCLEDFDHDFTVNVGDLLTVLNHWTP